MFDHFAGLALKGLMGSCMIQMGAKRDKMNVLYMTRKKCYKEWRYEKTDRRV